MYLKIENSLIGTVAYSFDGDEVFIGSGPANHIVINLPSISKFHARIVCEEGKYFAADLGSTNGTYLIDQRIGKNKNVGILPGESVRLGNSVHVFLVEEVKSALPLKGADFEAIRAHLAALESAAAISAEKNNAQSGEKTHVLTKAALEKAKAAALKKKKLELRKKKILERKRKRQESKLTRKVIYTCLILLFMGWSINEWWVARRSEIVNETIINQMQFKMDQAAELEADMEGFRISRGGLVKRSAISKLFPQEKCQSEEVRPLCEENPYFQDKGSGVIFRAPDEFFFFVFEKSLFLNSKQIMPKDKKLSHRLIRKMAALNFLKEYVLTKKFPKGAQIYVTVYNFNNLDQMTLSFVSALQEDSIYLLALILKQENFPGPYEDFEQTFKKFDIYFTLY